MTGVAPQAADPLYWHGGALDAAEARFGPPGAGGWLDLSTGIAPVAYPDGLETLSRAALTRLPDRGVERRFVQAVRAAHGLPETAAVVPVPGEQAALHLLPLCGAPEGAVVVPDPGYGGHAEAWTLAGRPPRGVAAPLAESQVRAGEAAVVVVINPNNPTGQRSDPWDLLEAAARQAARGGWLIVDEAFAEVTPEVSVLRHAGAPGLIVLRSFGKFFGLPGLRLGWVAAPPPVAATLAARLGPWAVSGPALEIGARAEADQAWRAAQRRRLAARARRLDGILARAGWCVLGGTSLFRLAEPPGAAEAAPWFEALGRAGIVVRPFADHPRWLRFGLPPGRLGEERLARVLRGAGPGGAPIPRATA